MRHDRQWEVAFEIEDPNEESARFFRGLTRGLMISAAFWIPLALATAALIG